MCIFQSEQVIKLRFWQKITSLMFKSYRQLPFVNEKAKVNASYYVIKLLSNLIKDCRHLLSDNFIFQQDGAPAHTAAQLLKNGSRRNTLVSLEKSQKRMATEFARSQSIGLSWQLTFITETFVLLTKKLCKVWFVISEYLRRDCVFTWKSELWSLNCRICWTTSVILITFAGYVAWILICKCCELGEKICYNSRDIDFFLGDYFFGAPCISLCWPSL